MAAIGILELLTKIDTQGIDKGVKSVNKSLDSMKKALSTVGLAVGIAFSVSALTSFASASIDLASDLDEVMNVVTTTFGDMSTEIEKFAETSIESFGLSELSAKQFSSTFGAMFKGMGITGNKMTEMSLMLTGLSGDLASFYNISGEEAFSKLKGIITGETEGLKSLGIVMTQANLETFALSQGMKKAYKDMSEAEKVTLRYQFVLNATKDAQGDFAKTSDSYSNQVKILNENWKTLQATLGEAIIPLLVPLIQNTNELVGSLTATAEGLGGVSDWIITNAPLIEGVTKATIGFMLAWKATEMLAFIQTSGSVLGALIALKTALLGTTLAKIADSAVTAKLTLMYAKDFVVALASSVAGLTGLSVAQGLATISQIALTVATGAWNIVAGIGAVVTGALGAAVAFLTSPIGLVILAITALIAIVVLLVKHWDTVKETASKVWDGIVTVFSKAASWFKSKVLDPIVNGWKFNINLMLGLVEGFVNFFLSGINLIIKGINKLNFKLPDWAGGYQVGFNIPEIPKMKIPRLAKGGVIPPNSEFLAVLGDQRRGTNIEAPLETIKDALRDVLGEGGSGSEEILINVLAEVDGDTLFNIVKKVSKRRGKNLVEIPI